MRKHSKAFEFRMYDTESRSPYTVYKYAHDPMDIALCKCILREACVHCCLRLWRWEVARSLQIRAALGDISSSVARETFFLFLSYTRQE